MSCCELSRLNMLPTLTILLTRVLANLLTPLFNSLLPLLAYILVRPLHLYRQATMLTLALVLPDLLHLPAVAVVVAVAAAVAINTEVTQTQKQTPTLGTINSPSPY